MLQLVSEPSAATMAYGLFVSGGKRTALVFDMGGGTLDVALVEVTEEKLTVLAAGTVCVCVCGSGHPHAS